LSFPDRIMLRIQKGKIMRKLGLVIFLVYEQGANRREEKIYNTIQIGSI